MNRPGNSWSARQPAEILISRAGQPPQRPPSLGPTPGIGGPFRGPYPSYGMAPRNVMAGYPGLPNHRTAQNMVPQPSPGFVQQRTPGFPFGTGLQQQQSQQPQQQHPQAPLQQHGQQPPSQPSTAHSSLPPHLAQNATPSLGGGAPSVSSASEVGLDPNDFPALGSTPATSASAPSNNNGASAAATSYASQAGTGVPPSGSGSVPLAGTNPTRDFTADDFPALGGAQASQQQQPSSQTQNQDSHPPGLNGLHGLASGQQQPGLLNLGPRALSGLQSETEKQRVRAFSLWHFVVAAQAAWNSAGTTSAPQAPSYPSSTQNGAQHPPPPGVPPPSSFAQPPQPQPPAQPTPQPQVGQTPFIGNGNGNGNGAGPAEAPQRAAGTAPQTPAQQVLMSAADRWGLLGLLAMIKSADPDQALLAVGTDLGTMGLDMQHQGNLYSTFITPWADSSAAHSVEPDFHLPGCYNVQPPPPGPGKAAAFSDETLFFMFYSSPRDALQEVAAQELYNRNWRYHKDMRLWLTKESGTTPSQKVPGGEQGTYTFWDPDNWGKERKDMTVLYSELEEKSQPAFPGPGLQVNAPQPQVVAAQRGAFQGMAAM
ncbi:hypothetical protein BV25DRAFT_1807460 [Artomyces pyxidatus]|uniref:Uncharacterized protein n=1 Tax=Artomyces pyxidatus TaxID=48021 RepID=A0ACB8SVC9_9AGAM|nr:hypothetical protein BV25DRAFT_1807460 [Artomyces pyxidatus]